MALRSRLLMQTCLLAMMTGTGLVPTTVLAQSQAPVPLFLRQEAQQDATSQSGNAPSGSQTPRNFDGTVPTSGQGLSPTTFPSGPDAVQAVTLQAVDAEAVGTLGPSEGGLGTDMWNGTSRKMAATLIDNLPATPATRTARDLAERILLSVAALPQDNPDISILDARVAKLIEMGALDGAIDLVRAAPQGSRGSILAQAEVNALMIAGKLAEACRAIDGYGSSYDDAFWLKASVLCALYENNRARASFGVDLVREMEGETDKTFFELVSAIRGGRDVAPELLGELRPIDIALLAVAQQPIPTNLLETENAMAIIGLVNSEATDIDLRLESARKAEKLGLIRAEYLADIYRGVNFDPATVDNALDDAPEGVQARQYAKLYQAAMKTDVPAARAEILAALFEAAQIAGDFIQAARLTAPLLDDIPVNGDFAWFAVDALKASIAANNLERAADWLRVARTSANPANGIESRLILLYPTLAIAGLEDTGTPPATADAPDQSMSVQINEDVIGGNDRERPRFGLGGAISLTPPPQTPAASSKAQARHRARMLEWQEMQAARADQAQTRRDAELVFNLFEGFDIEVPVELWNSLLTPPYAEDRHTVSSAVSHQLQQASRAGQKAKTVALAIQAQQVASNPMADPRDLADTVAALKQVDLTAEARHLATELLLSRED